MKQVMNPGPLRQLQSYRFSWQKCMMVANMYNKGYRRAELFFDTAATAHEVRMKFVEKKELGTNYGKISVANSVTLATRIRIDIMQVIAKQFSDKN